MEQGTANTAYLCFSDLVEDERDVYDRGLEQELCRADFFQKCGLRFFRHADLTRVRSPAAGATARQEKEEAREPEDLGPYLLCRGGQALAALEPLRETGERRCPGGGLTGLTTLSFQRGRAAEAVEVLERAVGCLLHGQARWEFPVEPTPARLWPHLVDAGLVERHRREDGRLFWDVSAAGRELGLCWGWSVEDGKLREGPFGSAKAVKWLEQVWPAKGKRERALAVRLWELERDEYGWEVVERFARAKLGEYLQRYPGNLEKLEDTLGVGPDMPFHQAAALIQRRLKDPDGQTRYEGIELMRLLAVPILAG